MLSGADPSISMPSCTAWCPPDAIIGYERQKYPEEVVELGLEEQEPEAKCCKMCSCCNCLCRALCFDKKKKDGGDNSKVSPAADKSEMVQCNYQSTNNQFLRLKILVG